MVKTTVSVGDNPKYEPAGSFLGKFHSERHIELGVARTLIESEAQTNPYLVGGKGKLDAAVVAGDIAVLEKGGVSYVDRLSLGRLYHQPLENRAGISVQRYNTDGTVDPLDTIGPYEKRHLHMENKDGETIFDMEDAVIPVSWSDNDANIVMSKYAHVPRGEEGRQRLEDKIGVDHENSVAHIWTRVADYITRSGEEFGYFATPEDRDTFREELLWLMANRKLAFNSPVQFNAGLYSEYGLEGNDNVKYWRNPKTGEVEKIEDGGNKRPQNHACFILGPQDDLSSIAQQAVYEIGIFESGSGVGQDIGVLRSEGEFLSSGGKSSGPLSFWKGYDVWAGTIKSGGKSRRAARMTTMRQGHPDIMGFIRSKVHEEKKILALMRAGYEGGMDGEAVTSVAYQNTNISVRLDDQFFEQLDKGGQVELRSVTTGQVVDSVSSDRMLKEIAYGIWRVGDPGVQFETEIQRMHTCKNSGRINSSNPCSEYMFLDDSSCNLASLNVLRFSDKRGNLDTKGFQYAVRIGLIGQDILNQASGFPVMSIAQISPEFGSVGLGHANIGALLMRKGIPYDSEEARNFAAGITALMTGTAYKTSAELAKALGTFEHFEFNRNPMLEVVNTHRRNLENVVWDSVPDDIERASRQVWDEAVEMGGEYGFRNAQTTVLAPTGTIIYLLGGETTGCEPYAGYDLMKVLAGGGDLKLDSKEVLNGLANLGYDPEQIRNITQYILAEGTVIGSPHIKPEHQRVFETALGNKEGIGSIPFSGHIGMLGAMQPFISGAISKTNNFPERTTVKEIYDGLVMAHDHRLKALAAFRRNSKLSNALTYSGERECLKQALWGEKVDLPEYRPAWEWEFSVGGTNVHLISSEFPDTGLPGQLTFLAFKGGSTTEGLLKISGIEESKALKYGKPLEKVIEGWEGHRMEPAGIVQGHPFIKNATSIHDAAARILKLEYLGDLDAAETLYVPVKGVDGLDRPETAEEKEARIGYHKLRGFRSGSFRHLERRDVDEWDIESVLKDDETGGFVPKKKKKSDNGKKGNSNERGVACGGCGNMMIQTGPGCFHCGTCGDKVGGCGI